MQAIVVSKFGGPDVLVLREVEDPSPGRGEVRIRVRATAVNRADILQRRGLYPAPAGTPPDILGLEFAGEVDLLGEGVTELDLGDRVFGLAAGGAYADALCIHARAVAKIPDGLSWIEAAALPEAFLTAYDAMVSQASLAAGETVLVHAVGSGVGTAAVQIARAIGAQSVGTSRTANKLERAQSLGLTEGIVVDGGRFAAEVLARTHHRGVDVILDLVGGSYVSEDLQCLAEKGRLMVVGLLAGAETSINLALLLKKRIQLRGTQLRMRPLEERIELARCLRVNLVPLFARRIMKPVIDDVYPLSAAAEAHTATETNTGFGKIVLEIAS